MLGEGRVVQRGKFDQLVNSPASSFVERFVSAQRVPLSQSGREP